MSQNGEAEHHLGRAIRGCTMMENLIAHLLARSPWVRDRYSPARLRRYLEKWRRALKAQGADEGLALSDEEVFRHFRVSYLRTLSSSRRRKDLQKSLLLVINRIRKDRALAQAGVDPVSQDPKARGWRQRAVGVIEERLRLWKAGLRAAIPDLAYDDFYRYFRQRYLYVPSERFQQVEIEKGIRNTRNLQLKRTALKRLCIDTGHPQYERWNRMQLWELRRKNSKLRRAVEACRQLSLKFPPKSGVNARDCSKYLNGYSKRGRPTKHEEMLYKLILYFEGMTWGQLQFIKDKYLSTEDWRRVDLDISLNHLLNFKLLGMVDLTGRLEDRYYVGRRKYLREKIEACRVGRLEFARDVDQAELDQYLRSAQDHGEDGLGIPERLLLKLISHYGLVSYEELNTVYDTHLRDDGGKSIWSKSTPRTYLTKLIDLELVEVIGDHGRAVVRPNLTRVPGDARYKIHRGFLLN